MDDDLGYIDLEEKTLQPLDNPFGHPPAAELFKNTVVGDRLADQGYCF